MMITALQVGEDAYLDAYLIDRASGTARYVGTIRAFREGFMGGTCYFSEPGVMVEMRDGSAKWYQRRQVDNFTNVVWIGCRISTGD